MISEAKIGNIFRIRHGRKEAISRLEKLGGGRRREIETEKRETETVPELVNGCGIQPRSGGRLVARGFNPGDRE